MTITKTCNTCEHYPNDNHCAGCEWDKGKGENTKWELKKNPIVIERKVLDKIRDEIERKANSGQWSEATIYGMQKSIAIIDKYRKGVQE